MAETVAKERPEISISGKGRLAEEGLTTEGGVNIRIHCRSLDEVRFIHFIITVYPSFCRCDSPLVADEGRSNARRLRSE